MPQTVEQRYNLTIGLTPGKFVWFRVAKCGTRSTLAVLRTHVTEFDIEQGFQIRYSPKKYHDFLKFAFVRDPYTRIVSAWNDKIILGNPGFNNIAQDLVERFRDFAYFIDWLTDQEPNSVNLHFRPQTLLVSEDVDFVGRLENFTRDLSGVLRKIGMSAGHQIPHMNHTNLPQKEVLDSNRVLKAITEYYARDFERFYYPTQ
jgi:hypothetical protein